MGSWNDDTLNSILNANSAAGVQISVNVISYDVELSATPQSRSGLLFNVVVGQSPVCFNFKRPLLKKYKSKDKK